MDLVNIRDLFRSKDEYLDTTVTIGGWVRSLRNSKNFGFIVVNDGTFFEPVQNPWTYPMTDWFIPSI